MNPAGEEQIDDLKEKAIRGGAARAVALVAGSLLRVGSVMILARLLGPEDFGLVGMVTAFTGVLGLLRDFGLSTATVQRATVTPEQSSTLFWINLLVGALLTVFTAAVAPLVSAFYHEPRLYWITTSIAVSFLVNGAAVQHSALLQRRMRFTTLAIIDVLSLALSTAMAVGAANAGLGYWALVIMTITLPVSGTISLWVASGWVPGRPHRGIGLSSMMKFGGTLTLNGLVMYIASNFDKVLLGRFWGSEAIGMYGRAYQLIRMPTDNLNSVVGEVAFSALSRVQHDAVRLRRYFVRGHALVLALTVPITCACALFSKDLIFVLLGPKWADAANIFRLLAPTILVFAIVNPLGWLMNSLGLVTRGLKIAVALTPLMIGAYFVGLSSGPTGVAAAYSAVMLVAVAPLVAWAVHGTPISFSDVAETVGRPLGSIVAASALTFAVRQLYAGTLAPLPRLLLDVALLFGVYAVVLLFVAGQKAVFQSLLAKRTHSEEPVNLTSI